MLLAWTEYWIEGRYAPHMKVPQVTNVGLLMVVAGEVLRKAGICTARHHFTHRVQLHRREEHQLVTHGIYR